MNIYFILNETQKAELSQIELEHGYELNPNKIKTGEYALPIKVIENSGFKNAFEYLQTLEQRELSDNVFESKQIGGVE